jgi:hypothetical protein
VFQRCVARTSCSRRSVDIAKHGATQGALHFCEGFLGRSPDSNPHSNPSFRSKIPRLAASRRSLD